MAAETYNIMIRMVGAKTATADLSRLERQASRTADAMAFFRKALVLFSTVRAASGLVDLIDTAARVDNRLRVVTKSARDFADAQQFLSRVSKETFTGLDANAQGFARIVQATDAAGISQERAKEAFEAVAQAARIGGNTTAEYQSALIQLSQGLASGAVQGQELRSIAEQLPIVAQAIGDEFGVAGGKLIAFAKENEGILVTERVIKALSDALPELTERASRIAPTIAGAFENVRTSFVELVRDVNGATGIIGAFTRSILFVSDNLRTLIETSILFFSLWAGSKLVAPLAFFIQAAQNVLALTRVLGIATVAQMSFNTAVLANPYVRTAVAILSFIGVLTLLYTQFELVRTVVNALFVPLQLLGSFVSTVFNAAFNALAEVVDRLYLVWAVFVTALEPAVTAFQGIYNAVYPVIEPFLTWVSAIAEANPLLAVLTDILVAFITIGLAPAVLGLQAIVEVMYLTGQASIEVRDAMREATRQFFEAGEASKDFAKSMDTTTKTSKVLNTELEAASRNYHATAGASKEAAEQVNRMGEASSKASSSVKETAKASEEAKVKVQELGDEAEITAKHITALTDILKRLDERLKDTDAELKKSTVSLRLAADGSRTVRATMYDAAEATDYFRTSLNTASATASSASAGFNGTANSLRNVASAATQAAAAVAGMNQHTSAAVRISDFGNFGENTGFAASTGFGPSSGFGSSGLAGTTGTVGGTGGIGGGLASTELNAAQLTAANESARALAEANARMALGYDLLNKTVSQQLADGLISASEASSAFTTGTNLIERALNDPNTLTKLKAAGETMYSGIIDQVLNAAVDANQFLSGELVKVAPTKGAFANSSAIVSSGFGGKQNKVRGGGGIDTIMEQLTAEIFNADPNPFDIMAQFGQTVQDSSTSLSSLVNSAGGLQLGFENFAGSLNSATSDIEALYNKLDLARKNVSPLYGSIDPNQNFLGTGSLPGFANGGSMMVGGSGSPDSRLLMARVSPGERVDVLTRQQQRYEGGGDGGISVAVHLHGADAVKEYRNSQSQVDRAIAGSMRRAQRNARVQ